MHNPHCTLYMNAVIIKYLFYTLHYRAYRVKRTLYRILYKKKRNRKREEKKTETETEAEENGEERSRRRKRREVGKLLVFHCA